MLHTVLYFEIYIKNSENSQRPKALKFKQNKNKSDIHFNPQKCVNQCAGVTLFYIHLSIIYRQYWPTAKLIGLGFFLDCG